MFFFFFLGILSFIFLFSNKKINFNGNNIFQEKNSKHILFQRNEKIYQIDELTYQDDFGNKYVRSKNGSLDGYVCNGIGMKGYFDVYGIENDQGSECISLLKSHFISYEDAKKEFLNSKNVLFFKKLLINEKTESFKDQMFTVDGYKVFLGDITDPRYTLITGKNYFSHLYFYLNNSLKSKDQKIIVLLGKGTDKLYIFTVLDDYKERIEEVKKLSKEILKESEKVKINKKFQTKREKKLAQIYTTILGRTNYCYECLKDQEKVYLGMNGIDTLKSGTGVCDGIVKSIAYVMKEKGYNIVKETGLGCQNDKYGKRECENHAWIRVDYKIKDKNGKIKKFSKYYDPTFDLSTKEYFGKNDFRNYEFFGKSSLSKTHKKDQFIE